MEVIETVLPEVKIVVPPRIEALAAGFKGNAYGRYLSSLLVRR